MSGHSPINVSHFLKGIDFPAKRNDLLKQARQNKPEQDVLQEIEHKPDRDYATMADVMKEFGQSG